MGLASRKSRYGRKRNKVNSTLRYNFDDLSRKDHHSEGVFQHSNRLSRVSNDDIQHAGEYNDHKFADFRHTAILPHQDHSYHSLPESSLTSGLSMCCRN